MAAKPRSQLKRVNLATSQHPTSSRGISSGGAAAGGIGFQAQLGALFGLQLLAQVPVDHVLELGTAVPVWIRFETEAPVENILVATSKGGFIAVQAKTTVNLSSGADGGLAKTVQQFVRYWLVCRDGQGEQLWDRCLDPNKDRLVLAVGPTAPASIRVDLPAALRSHSQPSPGSLTQGQQRALDVFETCMREAWSNTTAEPWSPTVLRSVAQLVRVMTFDPAGAYANVMEGLAAMATTTDQARPLTTALTQISQRWMTERNGGDLPQLRQAVMHAQVPLSAPPRFEDDSGTLATYDPSVAVPDDQVPRLKACIELVDNAAMQLYFATGRVNGGTGTRQPPDNDHYNVGRCLSRKILYSWVPAYRRRARGLRPAPCAESRPSGFSTRRTRCRLALAAASALLAFPS
jgi:hypothetical protein